VVTRVYEPCTRIRAINESVYICVYLSTFLVRCCCRYGSVEVFSEMFQSIIYYIVRSTKLETWLENESIRDSLHPTLDKNYCDLDPTFASSVDEDYDHRLSGVSKNSFTNIYIDWIQYCASHRDKVGSVFCVWKHFNSHLTVIPHNP